MLAAADESFRLEQLPGGCYGKGDNLIHQTHSSAYALILEPNTTFTNHISWHVLDGKERPHECSGR